MDQLLQIGLACVCVSLLTVSTTAYADEDYDTDFIELLEVVYGEGYLSQGGPAMVEYMFKGIELEGKKILDLGCGVGGPALHLAKQHNVSIVGIDPEPIMIQQSQKSLKNLHSDSKTLLKGQASFLVMTDPLNLQQFADKSFDIVTSREAILHVPHEHKLQYFREIYRVLKDGGELVIVDWQHSSPKYSDELRTMMEMDGVPFYLSTPEDYRQTVVQAGFSTVTIRDLTGLSVEHTKQDLATIKAKQELIVDRFGKESYDYALHSWQIQGQAFEDRELLVGLVKAQKN